LSDSVCLISQQESAVCTSGQWRWRIVCSSRRNISRQWHIITDSSETVWSTADLIHCMLSYCSTSAMYYQCWFIVS